MKIEHDLTTLDEQAYNDKRRGIQCSTDHAFNDEMLTC